MPMRTDRTDLSNSCQSCTLFDSVLLIFVELHNFLSLSSAASGVPFFAFFVIRSLPSLGSGAHASVETGDDLRRVLNRSKERRRNCTRTRGR